jgi:signal transduction histidine kinase
VEDNGIGIPPQAHEKIFGIFERVSGLDQVEGTGIGLAIVARAMQQMGGACGVESEVGQGSRFWLELATAR